jgi:hypothetical protein
VGWRKSAYLGLVDPGSAPADAPVRPGEATGKAVASPLRDRVEVLFTGLLVGANLLGLAGGVTAPVRVKPERERKKKRKRK